MKFTVIFDVGDDYAEYGAPAAAFRDDLQALLYDNGEGATRSALAGQFALTETAPPPA